MVAISVLNISFSYDGKYDLFSNLSCSVGDTARIAIIDNNRRVIKAFLDVLL